MSGFFVRVDEVAMPNCFAAVTARAVARHVVSESGNLKVTRATPSLPVITSGFQNAVERKSLRTLTSMLSFPSPGGGPGLHSSATAGRLLP